MTEVNEPTRAYSFGINVESASELGDISRQVRDFMTVVGAGDCEIQVAVNPALTESSSVDCEEKTPVMGFLASGVEAYVQEVDEEDDEGEDEYYDRI